MRTEKCLSHVLNIFLCCITLNDPAERKSVVEKAGGTETDRYANNVPCKHMAPITSSALLRLYRGLKRPLPVSPCEIAIENT